MSPFKPPGKRTIHSCLSSWPDPSLVGQTGSVVNCATPGSERAELLLTGHQWVSSLLCTSIISNHQSQLQRTTMEMTKRLQVCKMFPKSYPFPSSASHLLRWWHAHPRTFRSQGCCKSPSTKSEIMGLPSRAPRGGIQQHH